MEWVYTCEGISRQPNDKYSMLREPNVATRCGCTACVLVAHDHFLGHYTVTKFGPRHNHDL